MLGLGLFVRKLTCIVASLGGGSSDADPDWLRERSRRHKGPVLCYAGLYVRVDSPRFEGLSVLRSKLCVV